MSTNPDATTVYTVISADAHAGLPTEQYRDYLEKKYWPQFDEFLADRVNVAEEIHRMGTSSEEFAKKWFEENEEGLEGGWDAERRNKEMDNDGITAEVIFPDADAVESRTCAPFGTGLGLSGVLVLRRRPRSTRFPNRWLAQMCANSPERRRGA